MNPLSTLDTKEPLDYDNLNIVTHPRPPRRRQSGISIVPFRPYVRCLNSVRQPFSFANGRDPWSTMGRDEIFFTQPNARCIGTLIDDCDISDSIRWDIEGESTRLPMMCKFWIIIDGAVVERGKPHMVQDAAIQVFTTGRNCRSILAAQQRTNSTITTTFDRRRRQSWHDINEYHSVPFYQYTRRVTFGSQQGIQCDLDNEELESIQEVNSDQEEESVDENRYQEIQHIRLEERIHHVTPPPEHRVHISMTTQTEPPFHDRSTSIDGQFVDIFNLNIETRETLLSEIVNPYIHRSRSSDSWETTTFIRNGILFHNRAVATGNDYPRWWLRLSETLLLSDRLTNEYEEQEPRALPVPSPRQEQAVQTEEEQPPRPTSSLHSPRVRVSSSDVTINNNYQFIDEFDDGNNAQRRSRLSDYSQKIDSHVEMDSRLSDRCSSPSVYARQSEIDEKTFVLPRNATPDRFHSERLSTPRSDVSSHRIRPTTTTTTTNSSNMLLTELIARYQRTLLQRQRAMTIVSDELLDIEHILKRYREKVHDQSLTQSNKAMELYRDISILSSHAKDDRRTSMTTSKYRSMPTVTCEEMIRAYQPSPRLFITSYESTSPRQRQPRFSPRSTRPDYCDLCLSDHSSSSAWIRYNEQRVNDLQKRIDLMLQMDDDDEQANFLSLPNGHSSETVTQRINQILSTRTRKPLALTYRDQIVPPRRLHVSLPSTPRSSRRCVTPTPTPKTVRISTHHHSVPAGGRLRTPTSSVSRPIVSILRRHSTSVTPRPPGPPETSHVWRSERDGKVYVLDQFSIPRYYRLYNDVSFREMYKFSLLLDNYIGPNRTISSTDYSSLVRNFAFNQGQGPTPISSVA